MTNNSQSTIKAKPPVVVVVGHIDHGKSTLLDYIRKSNTVAGEAGGITQHVSAYEVKHVTEGKEHTITFLDTPGHEAFSSMRNRGAQISDIAILLVSAEEGVKAQTIEALKSVKEAGVPFVVAINKIDRPNANPDKVKQELAEQEVFVESYGGTIPSVNISAKTGEGIDDLLDLLILVSDLEAKSGDPSLPGEALILETNRDPKIGVTVTAIIKNGTLHLGDYVGVEGVVAKIKKMENFLGQPLKEATLSSPVLLYGFAEVPAVGAIINGLKDKKAADHHEKTGRTLGANTNNPSHTPELGADAIEIPIIIKADTIGTLEAVEKEVLKIVDERVRLKIIGKSIGAITDNDAKLGSGSNSAIILGFQVKTDTSAKDIAERFDVTIVTFDIIYKLAEWLAEEVSKRRPKVTIEETTGRAKILKCFSANKDKQVVGGQVLDGVFVKGKEIKIIRRDIEIGRGKVAELEQHKAKTDRVEPPGQFGTMIDSKIVIAPGDILEIFERVAK
ncbi:MAG: translation initiation factor IF-2 [Candidatus Vogelbacteria bacterium]|nr:translation initiation factor IF-2 [Candidatus Vogelbacteria bacterium]